MKELTGKARMAAWRNLPDPKPSWENFKWLVSSGETPNSALKRWREWEEWKAAKGAKEKWRKFPK
tara:strand:+ start:365 stop:559 length:195 start_codon:yes stop_codon:yes gene_type:complete